MSENFRIKLKLMKSFNFISRESNRSQAKGWADWNGGSWAVTREKAKTRSCNGESDWRASKANSKNAEVRGRNHKSWGWSDSDCINSSSQTGSIWDTDQAHPCQSQEASDDYDAGNTRARWKDNKSDHKSSDQADNNWRTRQQASDS